MLVKPLSTITLFLFVSAFTLGQQRSINALSRLKSHLSYLASDSLEGRRSGTNGEAIAAKYIADQFKQYNLSYYSNLNSYLQDFEVFDGLELSKDSKLSINNFILKPLVDFYPLSFSSTKAIIKTEVSPGLNERNHIWVQDISEFFVSSSNSPHFDIIDQLRKYASNAELRGASGLILYAKDSSKLFSLYSHKFKDQISIPVIFVNRSSLFYNNEFNEPLLQIEGDFELVKKYRNSKNVIGFINNDKPETVVIGAHYDHLGYGEDGNSMIKPVQRLVHNGADDNASGTSALIEIANSLQKKLYRNYNYIIIAFSSEELGLLGSKHFVDKHDFSSQPIKYMINMDMVGRLNDSSKVLTIGGYGTSTDWSTIFKKYTNSDLYPKFDSSGTGPSDHTSFYRKNIPVLFYFTGIHSDYHKPSDDADKINYGGIQSILNHILFTLRTSNKYPITFIKTREQQTSTNTRFTVSIGIMPDYSYQGEGVRIDGISEGKLAQKIGLLASDIIVSLGENKITSVESYMKALSNFRKGDTTQLTYLRNSNLVTQTITFQ